MEDAPNRQISKFCSTSEAVETAALKREKEHPSNATDQGG
jgi:hypothetical protein